MNNTEQAYAINQSTGKREYQSGNDPENPNGMKVYMHKGRKVYAYCAKDVPMKYKALYGNN